MSLEDEIRQLQWEPMANLAETIKASGPRDVTAMHLVFETVIPTLNALNASVLRLAHEIDELRASKD